jgi:hypothetical protein
MNDESHQQKDVSLPPSPKGRGLLYGLVTLGLLGIMIGGAIGASINLRVFLMKAGEAGNLSDLRIAFETAVNGGAIGAIFGIIIGFMVAWTRHHEACAGHEPPDPAAPPTTGLHSPLDV